MDLGESERSTNVQFNVVCVVKDVMMLTRLDDTKPQSPAGLLIRLGLYHYWRYYRQEGRAGNRKQARPAVQTARTTRCDTAWVISLRGQTGGQ